MSGPRIVTPGMGERAPSDAEIKMMQYQGLANLWAQYAELLIKSDITDREKKSATAFAHAAGYVRIVIDSAENQIRRMEVIHDADQKRPD